MDGFAASCPSGGCGSSSEVADLGLVAVAVVALVLLVVGVRRVRQARRRNDPFLAAVAAVMLGLAVFLGVAFLSGMRTYTGISGGTRYSCAPWWEEAALPSDAQGVAGDNGPCRQRAIDAIGPALGVSAIAGLVAGAVTAGALVVDRRRARSRNPA